MSVFKKAVTGFNHNIKHKGKLYHIQTEDSGVNNPHIITHLFVGGNILASKKTSYADIINAENLGQVVRDLMEEQHKEMLHNLLRGIYDVAEQSRSFAPGQLEPSPEAPVVPIPLTQLAPTQPPQPLPPEVLAARQLTDVRPMEGGETLFGEDLISEKSLDEVILAYLAGETDNK